MPNVQNKCDFHDLCNFRWFLRVFKFTTPLLTFVHLTLIMFSSDLRDAKNAKCRSVQDFWFQTNFWKKKMCPNHADPMQKRSRVWNFYGMHDVQQDCMCMSQWHSDCRTKEIEDHCRTKEGTKLINSPQIRVKGRRSEDCHWWLKRPPIPYGASWGYWRTKDRVATGATPSELKGSDPKT